MKLPDPLPSDRWADVSRTDRFVCVQPLSGYRIIQPDDDGYTIYLSPDSTDESLGQAVLECLGRSRYVWPADEPGFDEWQRYIPLYKAWQKDFMRRYGYKTKREAYRNLDWCRVHRSRGRISLQPHKRDKPEYFRDLPDESTVVIPETMDAVVVGGALRQALARCE